MDTMEIALRPAKKAANAAPGALNIAARPANATPKRMQLRGRVAQALKLPSVLLFVIYFLTPHVVYPYVSPSQLDPRLVRIILTLRVAHGCPVHADAPTHFLLSTLTTAA